MSEEEDVQLDNSRFKLLGVWGINSVFHHPFCLNDRVWRKQTMLSMEKFQDSQIAFDECENAFLKPKIPYNIPVFETLHKYSEYEASEE